MIGPSDKEYKATKLIKQGKSRLRFPFDELARWISSEYGTHVLNVCYSFKKGEDIDKNLQKDMKYMPKAARANLRRRPPRKNPDRCRLQVVLELDKDKDEFVDKATGNYDEERRARVAGRSEEILAGGRPKEAGVWGSPARPSHEEYVTDGMSVVFSAFERVAKKEAYRSIPGREIRKLKRQLKGRGLWKIRESEFGVDFFVYTEDQVRESELNGNKEAFAHACFSLLKRHDEFDYFRKGSVLEEFSLKSKEAFKRDYKGSWYNYDRR